MGVTAIIPARGGSKGIPLKNVLPLGGRPLLAWSIRQALESHSVSSCIVSTDSEEIAAVAIEEGASVFWRSAANATDTATTEAAVVEVLESLTRGVRTKYTLLLQATSPIRQPHDIQDAINLIRREDADSLFAARRVEGYVWQSALDTGLLPLHGGRLPRQYRPETVWEENGSLYVFRTESFLAERTRLCGRTVVYEMDPFDSYQLDEYADIERLEQLMHLRSHDRYHAATH
jgi:N-acylneuraminate cytidylyltransferase